MPDDHRHFQWNHQQSLFKQTRASVGGPTLYVDFEGAVRAGKSTPAASKLADYVIEYPGIHMAACRWTQDSLDAQVRPLWRDWAGRQGLHLEWHGDEEYDEVLGTGSRVYLRALKASEQTARYGKLAGLTLAVLWIDQPEEVPKDIINAYVPARLSQPGYPHEVWYTPNPPNRDHWIDQQFPEPESGQDQALHHTFIRTAVYDNRHILGDEYIAALEARYPVGSALRRRFVEGRRGLMVDGEPVYASAFRRDRHVRDCAYVDKVTLLESWDFGHRHPAVTWGQTVNGQTRFLGELMGHDQFLEDFVPQALAARNQLFPRPIQVLSCCDPAGEQESSHGVRSRAVDVLHTYGVMPRSFPDSNAPARRYASIQALAREMLRSLPNGEAAVVVHPRCVLLADGFEAGYVWDTRQLLLRTMAGLRMPRKDGLYDHLQNTVEYLMQHFGPMAGATVDYAREQARLEQRTLKQQQQDYDPYDRLKEPHSAARGGYR